MIDRIAAVYPPKKQTACIVALSHAIFHVCDPPLAERLPGSTEPLKRLPCTYRVGPTREDRELTVHNKSDQPIHLVAIDSCLFDSNDPSRCDCALVKEEIIQFVEFKHGNFRRRTERVRDCISQLAKSINDFYSKGILPARHTVLAIACVGFTEEFPPQNASLEALQARLNLLVSADVLVELHVTDTTVFG